MSRLFWAHLRVACGDLVTGEPVLEGMLKFPEEHRIAWTFVNPVELGLVAFLRGNLPEAERRLRDRTGIAAACAGDWSAAEQHHLTAIHQTGTARHCMNRWACRERRPHSGSTVLPGTKSAEYA